MDSNATGTGELNIHEPFDSQDDSLSASESAAARTGYGLMDVLMPANPPIPKNARIVRLFDLEAAKFDPRPATPQDATTPAVAAALPSDAAPAAPVPKDPRGRSALREERRSSLAAAAGLF